MKVARYDYESQVSDWPALMEELEAALRSGSYVLGPEVSRFEEELAALCSTRFAVGVGCGTDALVLAFMALGIGAGDRIVTQANTFHATVSAIRLVGARPVLVDADPESFTLDPAALESVDGDVRAVVPVHLYGRPCDMEPVERFATARGAAIVEDAAQAIGATSRGRPVGSIGSFGCFSFHPSKNLAAAGDGGAIVHGDPDAQERLEALRSLGQVAQNDHAYVGLNSKLDVVQAIFLRHKLSSLPAWNAERRELAALYTAGLSGLPLRLQSAPPEIEHAYHLFQVRTERRDDLLRYLKGHEIDAVVRYPTPIHLQPAFADQGWKQGQFPVAEALAAELVALPVRPGMPHAEVEFVCERVREFFGKEGVQ